MLPTLRIHAVDSLPTRPSQDGEGAAPFSLLTSSFADSSAHPSALSSFFPKTFISLHILSSTASAGLQPQPQCVWPPRPVTLPVCSGDPSSATDCIHQLVSVIVQLPPDG